MAVNMYFLLMQNQDYQSDKCKMILKILVNKISTLTALKNIFCHTKAYAHVSPMFNGNQIHLPKKCTLWICLHFKKGNNRVWHC